jgi:hypothetical protein
MQKDATTHISRIIELLGELQQIIEEAPRVKRCREREQDERLPPAAGR